MALKDVQLIHIRVPKGIVAKIDKVAEREHRDRTAQVLVMLENAVKNE